MGAASDCAMRAVTLLVAASAVAVASTLFVPYGGEAHASSFAYDLDYSFRGLLDVASNSTHTFVLDGAGNNVKKVVIFDERGSFVSEFGVSRQARILTVTPDAVFAMTDYNALNFNFVVYDRLDVHDHSGTHMFHYPTIGQKIGETPLGYFNHALGMASNGTHVFVTDTHRDYVTVLNATTSDENDIRSSAGTLSHSSLRDPHAVAANATHVFVTDTAGDMVHVFDAGTGGHVSSFGSAGTGPGQFQNPAGIAVNREHIMVMDSERRDVQLFDLSGNYAGAFNHAGAGQLHDPTGIAASRFHTFVADAGGGDAVRAFANYPYAFAGDTVKGGGDGQFQKIQSIAANSENVFVLDAVRKDVQVLDGNGTYVSKFGGPGTGDGQFQNPVSVAANSEFVFVLDSSQKKEFHTFRTDGEYVGTFGAKGRGDGQFRSPSYIAANSTHVFVTDSLRDDVQIFDTDNGKFVSKFGDKGKSRGQLDNPSAVAANSTHILVADRSRDVVLVFDSSGGFVTEFDGPGDGGYFGSVRGMASGPMHTFTVDAANHRVDVFDPSGEFVSQFEANGGGLDPFGDPYDVVIHDRYVLVADRDLPYVVKIDRLMLTDTTSPSFTSAAALTFAEGATNVHEFTADEDGVTFAILSHDVPGTPPPSIEQGTLSWTPSDSHGGGTYNVTVQATDPSDNHGIQHLMITVLDTNTPPVLGEIMVPAAPISAELVILLSAADVDIPEDTLTFAHNHTSGEIRPTGDRTAVFAWTPTPADADVHVIRFSVSDGEYTDFEDVKVRVSDSTAFFAYNLNDTFSDPRDVDSNSTHVFVMDRSNQRIKIYDAQGQPASSFVTGAGMISLAVTSDKVFVAFPVSGIENQFGVKYQQIRIYNHSGTKLGEFEGGFVQKGHSPPDGAFQQIRRMAANDAHLFVTDTYHTKVQVFNHNGGHVGTLAHSSLGSPRAVAATSTHVFVTDALADRVHIFDAGTRRHVSSFGSAGAGHGQFDNPVGIAANPVHIMVMDSGRDDVQMFDLSGRYAGAFNHTGAGQLHDPTGITTVGFHTFVADTGGGDAVRAFDNYPYAFAGDIVKGDGDGQFKEIRSVAANSENVFVLDAERKDVQVLDGNGNYVSKLGGPGAGDGHFVVPVSVAANSEFVFVADSNRDDVQIFDTDGTFVGKFGGRHGTDPGKFRSPAYIAANSTHVFVADSNRDDVQIFYANGTFASKFGDKGAGPGQFQYPSAVAANSTHILVADRDRDVVLVFDSSGRFVSEFGKQGRGDGAFEAVRGMAPGSPHMFMVDSANHRVSVFAPSGIFGTQYGGEGTGLDPFGDPYDVAIHDRYVLVADRDLPYVVKIDLSEFEFDTTPPTLVISNITVGATDIVTAVNLGFPLISDEYGGPYVVTHNAMGAHEVATAAVNASFRVGTHVIQWSATDSSGNRGTTEQRVTVSDTTPPYGLRLNGDDPVSIHIGTPYTDAGISCFDTFDLSPVTTDNSSSIDTSVAGTYRIAYSCRDASGNEAEQQVFRTVIVLGTPAAPAGLAASPGDAQVVLSWTEPDDGGSPVTGYVVEYSSDGGTSWSAFGDGAGTATSVTVTGLTNGQQYEFRVNATNAAGTGPASDAVPATPRTVPAAPAGLAASPGDAQVVLSWTEPDDGGSPVTGYVVEYSSDGGTSWSAFGDGAGTATSVTVTGLTNGQQYEFRVSATNAAGTGPASGTESATPRGPPAAPAGLTATPGDAQVVLSWTEPDDGGSPVTGYTVEQRSGSAAWAPSAVSPVTVTNATVTGLTNGQQYEFRVNATNAAGTGPASDAVPATPRTVPAAPAGLAASPGDAQVVLSWTEPDDGGSPVTGYTVEQRSGSAAWAPSAVSPVTVTNATVTGLTNGQQYEFRVNATNAAGTGPASDAVPATPRTVPAAPAGLAASPGDAQVVLSWTEPDDGGSPVTGYTVEQRSGSA
ncbi:MAG: fibronectin type III domain-containing protein, partial [Thaumarchaeota archaeon]|nr:fibronectin type III domain-containing protein [Nitrososphaerota archaeon]